uniref:Uncharacterized protein n=1 Tax=Daphnia galeata TaxID=27404 RepID=A0A8J2WHA6_9CRUS|nr:unnamed protein product [Daphnia galeata]
MRSLVTLIICLFLVFINADTSPVHEYFERPSVERADRPQQIFHQVEKSAGWMGGAKTNFGRKRFHTTPNDVTIEDNLIENEESEQDLEMLTQVSSVLCEAGKTSGWLQCTDPTGETDRSEAEKVCQTHRQTLWTYAPRTLYQPFGFWICAKTPKTRARAGRRFNFQL